MVKKAILITTLLVLFAVSAFAQGAEYLRSFEITPNPMEKDTYITLDFAQPTSITLVVETLQGELITTVFSGVINKNETFRWERRNPAGQMIPAGDYFVTIHYGTRYTSTKKTLILK